MSWKALLAFQGSMTHALVRVIQEGRSCIPNLWLDFNRTWIMLHILSNSKLREKREKAWIQWGTRIAESQKPHHAPVDWRRELYNPPGRLSIFSLCQNLSYWWFPQSTALTAATLVTYGLLQLTIERQDCCREWGDDFFNFKLFCKNWELTDILKKTTLWKTGFLFSFKSSEFQRPRKNVYILRCPDQGVSSSSLRPLEAHPGTWAMALDCRRPSKEIRDIPSFSPSILTALTGQEKRNGLGSWKIWQIRGQGWGKHWGIMNWA